MSIKRPEYCNVCGLDIVWCKCDNSHGLPTVPSLLEALGTAKKTVAYQRGVIENLQKRVENDQNFIQNLIAERDQARERVAELEQSVSDFYKLISKWLQKGNLEPMWYKNFETFAKTIYEDANND